MTATAAPESIFSPATLGPTQLRNRAVKCGTNEGKSRDGLVTDRLIEWHRAFAVGGVGMTTLAYCSVSSEGRTFGDQIWMRAEALPGLRRFSQAIQAEGARAAIQLGHAGWFAHPRATGTKPVGPSRTFSPHAQRFSHAMTSDDFARMTREFADAARLAVDAGFDALEIHMGHGYLLSQFLSPYNNRRNDRWGGSIENRARFPRDVLRAVREAAGPGVAIFPKLNMEDGFPGGLTLEDSLQVAQWIEQDGSVDALQLTGGHTTRTPMFLMRGDVPLREMVRYERDWVRKLGLAVLGRILIRGYPWSEAFFLASARRFKQAVDLPIMLLGGLTELETMNRAIGEGFAFVALGRALIANPDLVGRMQSGELSRSICNHCNQCVAEMEREEGVRCVLEGSAA
ncbi:MAG: NADH:flavin oxidoreductase, partial [Deltaproteobacteria bacterium]|nr:NADH:flavin oxidoreductase [Deltaproteobacteria bacterium]